MSVYLFFGLFVRHFYINVTAVVYVTLSIICLYFSQNAVCLCNNYSRNDDHNNINIIIDDYVSNTNKK